MKDFKDMNDVELTQLQLSIQSELEARRNKTLKGKWQNLVLALEEWQKENGYPIEVSSDYGYGNIIFFFDKPGCAMFEKEELEEEEYW